MIILLLYWTYGKINRINESPLRMAYDDYISTFNELMIR